MSNLTSSNGSSTTQDRSLGTVGLSCQYRSTSLAISLFLSCLSYAEEENCMDESVNGIVEYSE